MNEPLVERFLARLESLRLRLPGDSATVAAGDAAFEVLYALVHEDSEWLRHVTVRLGPGRPTDGALRPWFSLFALKAASPAEAPAMRAELVAGLGGASHLGAVLVGAELVRLVRDASGAAAAWRDVDALGLLMHLRAFAVPSRLAHEGPLLSPACVLLFGLAAENGAFDAAEAIERIARRLPSTASPLSSDLDLACAEADIARGEYARALKRVTQRSWPEAARGHAAAVELSALAELGEGESDEAVAALERCMVALGEPGGAPAGSARSQRALLRERVITIARTSRRLTKELELGSVTRRAAKSWSLGELFIVERAARRERDVERRNTLFSALIGRAEALLEDDTETLAPEMELRLELLWCRILVELGASTAFDACEHVLSGAVARARELGSRSLEMLALDQRAVLRARYRRDLPAAIRDSAAAAEIAFELLQRNAHDEGVGQYRRSLLEELYPILERVLNLIAENAARAAELPELRARPVNPFDLELFEAKSPHGIWQRHGRGLHAFAETAQALALSDARRARDDGRADFVVAPYVPSAEPKPVLEDFMLSLKPTDAVLQYFLVDRYVLTFAYGRAFFHWHLAVTQGDSAEPAIERLVASLSDWVHGSEAATRRDTLAQIRDLLLPPDLVRTLASSRIERLGIVPHGALYALPFGRLDTEFGRLGVVFSINLQPTGAEAVRSSSAGPLPTSDVSFAHVVGPETERPDPISGATEPIQGWQTERAAIRAAARRIGQLVPLDGWNSGLAAVTRELPRQRLLHFSCHGREGDSFMSDAAMLIAGGAEGTLSAAAVARCDLSNCGLVVLQSCSTGWLVHRRTHPVQGLPQAFRDAGARAVIAPLTELPTVLALLFTQVFYRALRFLSAERALRRTLELLRAHGAELVREDARAIAAFEAWGGSFDRLEYRYLGSSNVHFGSRFSRLLGWVSFWRFERGLRRAGPR